MALMERYVEGMRKVVDNIDRVMEATGSGGKWFIQQVCNRP